MRRLWAVMETASLRGLAVIEAEDRKTPRSGGTERKANSMRKASISSAEREEVEAHEAEEGGSARARSCMGSVPPRFTQSGAFKQEGRRPKPRTLAQLIVCKPLNQGSPASSAASTGPGRRGKALPNPSLKPRPNSKTPGPRYIAVHHLQRGPGVFLSVPA